MRTQFSPTGPLKQQLDDVPAADLIFDYPAAIAKGDAVHFRPGVTGEVRDVIHYVWGHPDHDEPPFRYVVVF